MSLHVTPLRLGLFWHVMSHHRRTGSDSAAWTRRVIEIGPLLETVSDAGMRFAHGLPVSYARCNFR